MAAEVPEQRSEKKCWTNRRSPGTVPGMGQGTQQNRTSASGLEVDARQVELIAQLVANCAGLSRAELAATVCELLGFQRPNGRLKTRECRDLLERLDAVGRIELPDKARGRPRGSRTSIPCTHRGAPEEAISGTVRDLTPVRIDKLRGRSDNALWRELIHRHHYLGFTTAYGASLRYLVKVERPRSAVVGCLQFSSPAWRMAARDQWIGWNDARRRENLQRVVQNSRFLILPWVQVQNLASHVLALAARHVAEDWQQHFGVRPWLLETLVDAQRYAGTCYQAANWIHVGQTSGRGRMDREHRRHGAGVKQLFLYPLVPKARQRLRGEL